MPSSTIDTSQFNSIPESIEAFRKHNAPYQTTGVTFL